jgi:hypothetical protein
MSNNRIFVAAGSDLTDNIDCWQNICKEKLNFNFHDLTETKISNALISRKLIYKVNELIKSNNPNDIIVGIMWTAPDIHERYVSSDKDYIFLEKSKIKLKSVVDNLKNWRVLNYELIQSSKDCELYYKIFYNKLQSYVLSFEHVLRTQWYLNKLGIKYFMTTQLDFLYNIKNYIQICDFKKLNLNTNYNYEILSYSEIQYLYNMLNMNNFLPVKGMIEWVQENYSNEGFKDSENLILNSFGNEKFITEIILPFLKKTYNVEPN